MQEGAHQSNTQSDSTATAVQDVEMKDLLKELIVALESHQEPPKDEEEKKESREKTVIFLRALIETVDEGGGPFMLTLGEYGDFIFEKEPPDIFCVKKVEPPSGSSSHKRGI